MKALLLCAFLILGFGTAKAQVVGEINDGTMITILRQIESEVLTYRHSEGAMLSAYIVLKGTHTSVGLGIKPTVNPYLVWRPDLITDEVISSQVRDFINNGLKRDPPQRIVKPAYQQLVALLGTLQNARQ